MILLARVRCGLFLSLAHPYKAHDEARRLLRHSRPAAGVHGQDRLRPQRPQYRCRAGLKLEREKDAAWHQRVAQSIKD